MRKILLDFNGFDSAAALQEYLRRELGFPDWYGGNLDALFDCLCAVTEPTCVGISRPVSSEPADFLIYVRRVVQVFCDAEAENERLCVFLNVGGAEKELS